MLELHIMSELFSGRVSFYKNNKFEINNYISRNIVLFIVYSLLLSQLRRSWRRW